MNHAHILYSGTVQGVGFRYTVQRFAESLGLKGWVRNLDDGHVEITVQGAQALIEQLIAKIDQRYEGYIKDKHVSGVPSEENYQGFQIRM